MQGLALEWYVFLGTLNAAVAGPLRALAEGVGMPVVSALLFGLIGATSPCQLTTNVSALAYLAGGAGGRRSVARATLAYLLGKALVYTLLGMAVFLLGQQLAQGSIPVIVFARKLLGPLMVLLGLYLLGLVPLRFSVGHGPASWLEARASRRLAASFGDAGGAFLLGAAFALAFCPTLFLLFFGLTIPLALTSPLGVVYPGVFALGTTLPLLLAAGMLVAGVNAARGYARAARRMNGWLKPAAAVVFLLAGLNDTVVYWLL